MPREGRRRQRAYLVVVSSIARVELPSQATTTRRGVVVPAIDEEVEDLHGHGQIGSGTEDTGGGIGRGTGRARKGGKTVLHRFKVSKGPEALVVIGLAASQPCWVEDIVVDGRFMPHRKLGLA